MFPIYVNKSGTLVVNTITDRTCPKNMKFLGYCRDTVNVR